PLLVGAGRLRVPGAGHHQAEPEPPQPPPAGLGTDLDAPPVAGVPSEFGSGPQAAVGRLLPEGVVGLGLLLGGQLAPALVGPAAVGQTVGAVSVPALKDGAGVDVGQADQRAGPFATEGLVTQE